MGVDNRNEPQEGKLGRRQLFKVQLHCNVASVIKLVTTLRIAGELCPMKKRSQDCQGTGGASDVPGATTPQVFAELTSYARCAKENILCGSTKEKQCSTNVDNQEEDKPVSLNTRASELEGGGLCIMLQTALAWIKGEGAAEYSRVLLDNRSQRWFIVAELSRRLGCKGLREEKLTIRSFGGIETECTTKLVKVRAHKGNCM